MNREARSQKPETRRRGSARGFSLMEVLLLVVVLGIVGGAAGQALQSVAKVPVQADLDLQIETQLISKMESIRSLPFDSVTVGNLSSLTDTVMMNNAQYTRAVTVALADANGDGMTEATFKQVTIVCSGHSINDVDFEIR